MMRIRQPGFQAVSMYIRIRAAGQYIAMSGSVGNIRTAAHGGLEFQLRPGFSTELVVDFDDAVVDLHGVQGRHQMFDRTKRITLLIAHRKTDEICPVIVAGLS